MEKGAYYHTLDVIRCDYKLPLKVTPSSVHLGNNRSAIENSAFVRQEIENLLSKGCIAQVDSPPEVINPLTVAVGNTGKQRLVLDCRHINVCLFKFKFRCEDVSSARQVFTKGDFLFSFDLKSAYHHIEIFEQHRTFLGFAWPMDGVLAFFVFKVLPFGLSTAPYIFTKVSRVLISHWRSQGFKVFMFIDDGIGGAGGEEIAQQVSDVVKEDIIEFGFLLASEKCYWKPQLALIWLGHSMDMRNGLVFVTEGRIEKLTQSLESLIQQVAAGKVLVKARRLASIIGQIILHVYPKET